jgi:glycosyltransferase involved in cell wall biosynthesis
MNLISVIIPIHNGEDFVLSAFKNLSKQKRLEIPIEIIFVDNNSIDSSYKIANELASKHSNVKIFKEAKQGAGAARNKGFNESIGNLIYFYDVDDQLFDDTLYTLSKVLIENEGYDAVFGKMLKSHKNIDEINQQDLVESHDLIIKAKPYWGLLWFKDLSKVVGPPAFMYRRDIFIKLGKYQEELMTGQDTALDIKLGMNYNIAMIDKFVYLYYKHFNATTAQIKKVKSRAFMQWPRIIHSHIPFYLKNKDEKEYYEILKIKMYTSIAKMIHGTQGFKQRIEIRQNLLKDIQPMELPVILKLYTQILVLINNDFVLKFYLYYLLSFYTKKVSIKT